MGLHLAWRELAAVVRSGCAWRIRDCSTSSISMRKRAPSSDATRRAPFSTPMTFSSCIAEALPCSRFRPRMPRADADSPGITRARRKLHVSAGAATEWFAITLPNDADCAPPNHSATERNGWEWQPTTTHRGRPTRTPSRSRPSRSASPTRCRASWMSMTPTTPEDSSLPGRPLRPRTRRRGAAAAGGRVHLRQLLPREAPLADRPRDEARADLPGVRRLALAPCSGRRDRIDRGGQFVGWRVDTSQYGVGSAGSVIDPHDGLRPSRG